MWFFEEMSDDERTSFFDVNCGVRQGCFISPIFKKFLCLSDISPTIQNQNSRQANLNDDGGMGEVIYHSCTAEVDS